MNKPELLRHMINWVYDYEHGNVLTKPPTGMNMAELQHDYFQLTGCRWGPANGCNIDPNDTAFVVLGENDADVNGQIEIDQGRSPLRLTWDGLKQSLDRMSLELTIVTIEGLLGGLDHIQDYTRGLTEDECWFYTVLYENQKRYKELLLKKELNDELADATYRLQHLEEWDDEDWAEHDKLNCICNEIYYARNCPVHDEKLLDLTDLADEDWVEYDDRRAAEEYKYDGR